MFNSLIYMNGKGYLKLNFNDKIKSVIIKVRTSLFSLNDVTWRTVKEKLCTICNLRENENIYHILRVCPTYNHYRRYYYGTTLLSESEILNILNGLNWMDLYLFIVNCIKYRKQYLIKNVFI